MPRCIHKYVEKLRPTLDALTNAFILAWSEADGFVKKRLWFTLCMIIATSALVALAPVALKLVVDGFTAGQWQTASIPPGESHEPAARLNLGIITLGPIVLVLVYVLSQWLGRSLAELRMLFYGAAEARLDRCVSRRLFAHIMWLPPRFHLDRKSGTLNHTLVQGLAGYRIILQHAIFTVLPVILEILLIGAVLVYLQPVFLFILGLSTILYGIIFALGAAQISGPSRTVSSAMIDAHGVMTDSVLNYETVKYFNAEHYVDNRYDEALARSEDQWILFYRCRTLNGLLVALTFALSLGSATLVATQQVVAGTLSIGDFVLINTYMLQMIAPLEKFGAAFRDIAQGIAFLEKMMAVLNQKTEIALYENTDHNSSSHPNTLQRIKRRLRDGPCELIFEDVCFSYRPDCLTFKHISFAVSPGRTLAVVGPSGSGKSTLVKLLVQLYRPDSGEIRLNGVPISEFPLSHVRQAIAVVPQDIVLFNDTIGYNIGFGKPGCTQQEIEQAAALAHIHHLVDRLPDHYESLVGERGLKLSGGEKQRVSIARAVIKQPRIFVFDEATSSLDTRTERDILRNLNEISRGTTTLIIAHRLSTVAHADEIILLDRGEIKERGSHATLLRGDGTYAAMWRAQQQRDQDDKVISIV